MAASLLTLNMFVGAASAASDAPPQTHDEVVVAPKSSSIVVPVRVSLADLQTAANAQIPSLLYSIDRDQDACVPAQSIDKCVIAKMFGQGCDDHSKTKLTPAIACHLDGQVTRGALTLAGSGSDLSLSVPLDMVVTATGRGEIGKTLHQTVRADMVAHATMSFDVDENWRPTANVDANYVWSNPPSVKILGAKISFADKVDPKIHELILQLQQKLPDLLAQLKLRERAQKYWNAGFTTLRVSATPPVWVSIVSETVGYGGYEIANGDINLTFTAGGEVTTSLGARPSDPTPVPLPNLQRNPAAPGFDFSLPIRADYATLHDQLAAALKFGQEQTVELPGYGSVKLTVNNVTLYQTEGKSLAIGIDLNASPAGHFVAARGTVWLTTKLKIDNATRTVTPDGLTIYGKNGNGPLNLLVSLIQLPPFNALVENSIRYSFAKRYDKLLASANAAIERQITPELYADGKVDAVTAESVSAAPEGIVAVVDVHGVVAIHSGTLPPSP